MVNDEFGWGGIHVLVLFVFGWPSASTGCSVRLKWKFHIQVSIFKESPYLDICFLLHRNLHKQCKCSVFSLRGRFKVACLAWQDLFDAPWISTVSLFHTTCMHTYLPPRPTVRRCVAASLRHVGVLFLHSLHRHLGAELDQQASHWGERKVCVCVNQLNLSLIFIWMNILLIFKTPNWNHVFHL